MTEDLARFHNRYRPDIIAFLLERDGNICKGCVVPHILCNDVRLWRIDHIDGDENHTCGANVRLTCNSFNVRLRQKSTMTACVCACGHKPAGAGDHGQAGTSDQVRASAGAIQPVSRSPIQNSAPDMTIRTEGDATYIDAPEVAKVLDDIATGASHSEGQYDPPEQKDRIVLTADGKDAEASQKDLVTDALDSENLTPTMRKNRRTEAPFNRWLNDQLAQGKKASVETWRHAGAQEFKCSPETIKKYLKKRTNDINGDLRVIKTGDGEDDNYVIKK